MTKPSQSKEPSQKAGKKVRRKRLSPKNKQVFSFISAAAAFNRRRKI